MTRRTVSRRTFLAAALSAGELSASGSGLAQETEHRILIPNTALYPTALSFQERIAEKTGVNVELVAVPPETIEFVIREDVRTGANQVQGAVVPMWHIGGFLADNIIQPLDPLIADAGETLPAVEFSDELPAIFRLRAFASDHVALPIDGDCQLLYFQRDVFESEESAEAFESETGDKLAVPERWDQVLTQAEWWAGRNKHGVALNLAEFGSGVMPFLGMAAAYATPAGDPGQFWFERETFAPTIDSARHVEALIDFQRLASTGSPDQHSWFLPDAWRAFLDGDALFTIAGADLLTAAIDWQHPRRERIGVARLPVATDRAATPVAAGTGAQFVGNALGPCWGGIVGSTARQPDVTLQALAMFSESGFQQDRGWSVDDSIDPARRSQLPPDVISGGNSAFDLYTAAGFSAAQAREFPTAIAQTLDAELQQPYLRIPGAFDYLTALEERVVGFLKGELASAVEALTIAAADFDALSLVHGVDRQHEMYLISVT